MSPLLLPSCHTTVHRRLHTRQPVCRGHPNRGLRLARLAPRCRQEVPVLRFQKAVSSPSPWLGPAPSTGRLPTSASPGITRSGVFSPFPSRSLAGRWARSRCAHRDEVRFGSFPRCQPLRGQTDGLGYRACGPARTRLATLQAPSRPERSACRAISSQTGALRPTAVVTGILEAPAGGRVPHQPDSCPGAQDGNVPRVGWIGGGQVCRYQKHGAPARVRQGSGS